MDRNRTILLVILIVIASWSVTVDFINYNKEVNQNKGLQQITNSNRFNYTLEQPIRGKLVSDTAHTMSDNKFYALLVDSIKNYTLVGQIGVKSKIYSYNLFEAEIDTQNHQIINSQLHPVKLNTNQTYKYYDGLAYDGNLFFTLEYRGIIVNSIVAYNVISFTPDGTIVSNQSLDLPALDNFDTVEYVRRDSIEAFNGFLYVFEYIYRYQDGISWVVEQIGKYSLPNLQRLDTIKLQYEYLFDMSIDKTGNLYLEYGMRPDKNITYFSTRDQPVYASFYSYNISRLTNQIDGTGDNKIILMNYLQTYDSKEFEYERLPGMHYKGDEKLYENLLVLPYWGEMSNVTSHIKFNYFFGLITYGVQNITANFPYMSGILAILCIIGILYILKEWKLHR